MQYIMFEIEIMTGLSFGSKYATLLSDLDEFNYETATLKEA